MTEIPSTTLFGVPRMRRNSKCIRVRESSPLYISLEIRWHEALMVAKTRECSKVRLWSPLTTLWLACKIGLLISIDIRATAFDSIAAPIHRKTESEDWKVRTNGQFLLFHESLRITQSPSLHDRWVRRMQWWWLVSRALFIERQSPKSRIRGLMGNSTSKRAVVKTLGMDCNSPPVYSETLKNRRMAFQKPWMKLFRAPCWKNHWAKTTKAEKCQDKIFVFFEDEKNTKKSKKKHINQREP